MTEKEVEKKQALADYLEISAFYITPSLFKNIFQCYIERRDETFHEYYKVEDVLEKDPKGIGEISDCGKYYITLMCTR